MRALALALFLAACGDDPQANETPDAAARSDAAPAAPAADANLAMAVGDAKAADIEQWNPVAATFAPDPALRDRYGKLYRIFRDLYPTTRKDMVALDTI